MNKILGFHNRKRNQNVIENKKKINLNRLYQKQQISRKTILLNDNQKFSQQNTRVKENEDRIRNKDFGIIELKELFISFRYSDPKTNNNCKGISKEFRYFYSF